MELCIEEMEMLLLNKIYLIKKKIVENEKILKLCKYYSLNSIFL